MFRRLKWSVTWGPINNSFSDNSFFFFNLYLQQFVIYVLAFPYLCFNYVYCTTKWHNKEKWESYIPSTTHPPNSPHPSSSAFSGGLFRGLDPNYRPNPYPTTAASPEFRRVKFLNCIRSDMGRIGEEVPEGVGSRFGPEGGDKLRPAPSGRYDPALEFSTSYRIISPICMTSYFLVI